MEISWINDDWLMILGNLFIKNGNLDITSDLILAGCLNIAHALQLDDDYYTFLGYSGI